MDWVAYSLIVLLVPVTLGVIRVLDGEYDDWSERMRAFAVGSVALPAYVVFGMVFILPATALASGVYYGGEPMITSVFKEPYAETVRTFGAIGAFGGGIWLTSTLGERLISAVRGRLGATFRRGGTKG